MTVSRPQWEELPDEVRDTVQAECGPVLKAESMGGGITHGLAARLHLQDGTSVVCKAIQVRHSAAEFHLREQWAAHALPQEAPVPARLWAGTLKGWHALVLQDTNGNAHEADLSPGSPDLQPVLGTLARLNELLTPCPPGAEPVAGNISTLQVRANRLLKHASSLAGADHDLYGRALDDFTISTLDGDTLVHNDLSADNLLVNGEQVTVVNWALAVRGAAWIEAATLAPRLVQARHDPADADKLLLSTMPAWATAPEQAVIGLTALWTLLRIYQAKYGPVEHRQAHAAAAEAGRAWLEFRMNPA